jgi:hypothetical protein
MKHFLHKKNLTICGAGGKKGGGQQPPPPDVSQYPSVLAPPQFSSLESIDSFSYAEMIDLLSDGPIEGIVNKNGKKVYDENIFEGIYLNDTPIKETSTIYSEKIDINFLKESLKTHFSSNPFFRTSSFETKLSSDVIENANFNSEIKITSYSPAESIFNFVKSLNGSFDAIPLIEKTFSSSPIISESPFLTIIKIPKFKAFLSKEKFDVDEGGAEGASPIKLEMSNISNYIYFSISSDSLNSFNYFELPRSFILNNITTSSGKKTVRKNLISKDDFYEYEFLDINIYIWSLYNKDIGIKPIDNILDKYFSFISVTQNQASLYNYNLVQSEFKNGLEYQAPLKNFDSVQIDTEYNKELIGPYKISGNYNPVGAYSAGGVQRVSTYDPVNPYTLPSINIDIDSETSDDIRYVRTWPVEYDCKNAPYVICNAILNYSQFDKSSSSRIAQEAVPVTHYIENENVEEVFITLNINQLFDTNHVDLVADNSKILGKDKQSKLNQTDLAPNGINTYGQVLGYKNPIGYTSGDIYLLVYGSNYNDGYVLDGYKTTGSSVQEFENAILCNLSRLDPSVPNTLYYQAIDENNGLAKCVPNLATLIGKNLYNASEENCLSYFEIPNDSYLVRESFNIKSYSLTNLESKLKLTTSENYPFYCFGLDQSEQLFNHVLYTPTSDTQAKLNAIQKNDLNKFFIAKLPFRTASQSQLTKKAIISHIINSYIDWDSIRDPASKNISLISERSYPNIYKYILNPYFYLNQVKNPDDLSLWQENIIGNIYLIALNGSYLRSKSTQYFTSSELTFFKLNVLEQLLEEFSLKTDQSTNFNFSLNQGGQFISDLSTTKALENALIKFSNGKLIGSSSIFNFKPYPLKSYVFPTQINDIKYTINEELAQYNSNNIYLYDTTQFSIDAVNDKDSGRDVIFEYNLYSNVFQTSILTPTNKATYVNFDTNNEGSQVNVGAFDGVNLKQQITAGTKLPAVVVIDVETGYEKKERENYIGPKEFFCYRYNIYGIATDQAMIDLGRKSNSFVVACKLTSDRGGYVSNYKTVYSNDLNLHLIQLICCDCTADSSVASYFLTDSKAAFPIGQIDINNLNENPDLSINKIIQNQITIGLCQSESSNDYDGISENFTLLQSVNIDTVLQVSDKDLYFYDDDLKLNISYALDYLRSKKFISENLTPTSSFVESKSVSQANTNNYDKYIYEDPVLNKYIEANIYNFNYDLYERLYVENSELSNPDSGLESQNFYSQLFTVNISSMTGGALSTDSIASRFIFNLNKNKTDGFYFLNTESTVRLPLSSFWPFGAQSKIINIIYINNKDYDELDQVKYLQKTLKDTYETNVLSGPISNVLSLYIKVLEENISTIDTNLISYDERAFPTKETDFVGKLNNELSANDYFIWPAPPSVDSKPTKNLEIESENFYKVIGEIASPGLKFIYLANTSGRPTTGSMISGFSTRSTINSTHKFTIKATDKRLNLQNSTKSISVIKAKFWTIFNYKTNQLSVVANAGQQSSGFEEIGFEFNYLNLHKILDGYNGINFWVAAERKPTISTILNDPYYEIFNKSCNVHFDNKIYFAIAGWTNGRSSRLSSIGVNRNNLASLGIRGNGNLLPPSTQVYSASVITLEKDKDLPFVVGTFNGFFSHISAWSWYNNNNISFSFYNKIRSSYLFENCNPELKIVRNACLITQDVKDFTKETSPLVCTEKFLLENNLINKDFRFIGSLENRPIYKKDYTDSSMIVSYYEMEVSNASSYQINTLSNDTGLKIEIPKPKKDADGNILRRYVKVIKKSHETLSPLISKRISLQKITEIIPQKFSYPFSAIVGTKIDSRAFSQIPVRTFHCKLKKVLIPSNYFIYDDNEEDVRYKQGDGAYRIYDGDWDGTFKLGWTNNPAWIMLDLLINKRYGLGNYIESEQVDIWELYKISRWCDGVNDAGYYYGVSDLYGGVEPRHSFNALINEKFNVFDLINQVASVFRGHVYYLNSLITFDDDRIKPLVGEFNNLDVKDGLFTYTNHKKDDEYTAADVAYVDAKDNYKPKIEYVEDQEGIRQRGILKKQINAFGVTSKAQARRFGQYFLYQTSKENSNVSFTTDNRALLYRPGDLIRINDELMSSNKTFGKITAIQDVNNDCFQVVIDQSLNENLYDVSCVTLFSPIAKPKYEDFYSASVYVPTSVCLSINNIFGLGALTELKNGTINNYDGFYRKTVSGGYRYYSIKFNMEPFDTASTIKSFSGVTTVNYAIEKLTGINGVPYSSENSEEYLYQVGPKSSWVKNPSYIDWGIQRTSLQNKFFVREDLTGYLCYVENVDINNNPQKYGHWEFTIGNDPVKNFKIKYDTIDQNIKAQLPYKNYFFNYIDKAKLLALSGVNDLGENVYSTALEFNPNNVVNTKYLVDCYGVNRISTTNLAYGLTYKFSFYTGKYIAYSSACRYRARISDYSIIFGGPPKVLDYGTPTISYSNILENNRPSIDSFNVLEYKNITQYETPMSVLTLDKYSNGVLKSTVANDFASLCVGSPYSLTLKNHCEKIYKIMSITENYINEYNLFATEFNFNKFKEIEDNSQIDNLKNTFNMLHGYSEVDRAESFDRLIAPIILSINYYLDSTKNKFIQVKWSNTQNASSYLVYIQTPSKQTSDYFSEVSSSSFNKQENCFIIAIKIPNNEVGTFTVSIQSKRLLPELLLSPLAKRSINIINY